MPHDLSEHERLTAEQMCRDLLTKAIDDGLVDFHRGLPFPHPQTRTSDELVGMANLLSEYLSHEHPGYPK